MFLLSVCALLAIVPFPVLGAHLTVSAWNCLSTASQACWSAALFLHLR